MVFIRETLGHESSRNRSKEANLIEIRIDDMTALSYLLNMGGTQNKHLIKIAKKNCVYLMERKQNLTAEYILSLSNQTADC